MLLFVHILLALILMVSALFAVMSQNLIRAVVALGIGSVALATVMFLLGAPYAGGFELSVGAGLISVLFIIAISLTESMGAGRREP